MRAIDRLKGALASSALAAACLIPLASAGAQDKPGGLTQKINAYVGCINRLSERSYESRSRYQSWVGKNGPTGRERIIYGTYTIYDTADCKKNVAAANLLEPREPELEAAAAAYVEAVVALEPLLKEADNYYTQENYKDDKMAKGKALHPRLLAAWTAFASADQSLRGGIDGLQDKQAAARLVEIEAAEGKKARYHVEATLVRAKRLVRTFGATKPDLSKITPALTEYEAIVKDTETFAEANKGGIGSSFVGSAKSFLTSAKQLMRRLRDKVPYSTGDRMMLNSGGGWMVEGSPARVTRDYNQLVEAYNRGGRF